MRSEKKRGSESLASTPRKSRSSQKHPFPKDKTFLIDLDDMDKASVLTPKRLEILSVLRRGDIKSVSELARKTERRLDAVSHDLRILSDHSLIEFERSGRTKKPMIVKDYIIMPLR